MTKDRLRKSLDKRGFPLVNRGVMAQKLRGLPAYRCATQLFVAPGPGLEQIRINALLDGKSLLMPAPSLHQGFYLFSPQTIPPSRLSLAVSNKGMSRYGRKLATAELGKLRLNLLISEALAMDCRGFMLDDGNGFFDLSAAILADCGALSDDCLVLGAARSLAPEELLPNDPWDLPADYRLEPGGITPVLRLTSPRTPPRILWEHLPEVRVRRITPLWQLQL